jgi:hypothetical protein
LTLHDDTLLEALEALRIHGNKAHAAKALGLNYGVFYQRLLAAARRGLTLPQPALDGFEISRVTTGPDGEQHVTQRPAHGDVYEIPSTHKLGKLTVNRDAEGRVIQDWIRVEPQAEARAALMREAIEALKTEIPRAAPVNAHRVGNEDLLNQYTVTDLHFGMLSWREETGADYDLRIAEDLLSNWFDQAIRLSPDAHTAILAQLGDLLHFDSLESVTPTNRHILDADSRFAKIVRIVIRTMRRVITMLLQKHERVHIIMADANHDPASEIWLREMFAAFYEDEPRVTVDRSPGAYNAYQFGQVALFYHHGHKKKIKDIAPLFAGLFRDIYGSTKYAYGHMGHLHQEEVVTSALMKVERHATLAAPDAYAANGGYLSSRSASCITYHRSFGEVGRITIRPEMLQQGH